MPVCAAVCDFFTDGCSTINYAILCKIVLNRDYISTVIVHFVKLGKMNKHVLYYLEKRGKENEMQYCLNCNFA